MSVGKVTEHLISLIATWKAAGTTLNHTESTTTASKSWLRQSQGTLFQNLA